MVAVLANKVRAEKLATLHPIDRVIEAKRLADLIPAAPKEQRARLFNSLVALAQEHQPVLNREGKTDKVETFPEIVQTFMEALQAEQLVESSLLGARYGLRGPQNEAIRQEIAQRTYAAIPESLKSFRREAGVMSYVLGIAANQYHGWVQETAKDATIDDLPENDVLAGAVLRSSMLLNKMEIGDVMADLAPKHREIINLTFFEGLSAGEIRTKLNLTEGQYRNRRRQALMPYYERRSLRFRLRKTQFPQPLEETIRIAGAFTEVLGELHRHGFTHADFKPDNVLLESLPAASDRSQHSLLRDDERLVLSDFSTLRSTGGYSQFGEGTLGYAAPELLTTLVEHDPRVDVFAASATLVECITGVPPSQVRSAADSTFDDAVLRFTGRLGPALRKGLSFDPADRQSSISEWFDSVLAAAQAVERPRSAPAQQLHRQTAAEPAGVNPAGAKKAKQQASESLLVRVGKAVGSLVALVAVMLVGYWALTQGASRPVLISSDAEGAAPADTGNDSGSDTVGDPVPVADPFQSDPVEANAAVPPLLETVPDPAWETPRRRITGVQNETGQAGQSDGARFHRIVDTSRLVMSPNERWILAQRDGIWTAVDRSTGEFQVLDLETQSQPVWHPSEPETILHLDVDELALLATTMDGQTTVAADLSDEITAVLPDAVALHAPHHGEPSANGLRFAWAVANDAGQSIGFVTYDLGGNQVTGLLTGLPEGELGDFDSIAMSKGGDEIVLAFSEQFVIYDGGFTNERRIDQRTFPYELAFGSGDRDTLVFANFEAETFGTGWIVAYDLESGESRRLFDLFDGSDSNVQLSGLATERQGWILASTHDCADPETWSCDRIMALNIDDSTVINLAETNSCAASGFTNPTATVNRDFTKAWFNTDFGSCGEDATIVELTIDQLDEQ